LGQRLQAERLADEIELIRDEPRVAMISAV
jgi:hypothetical protein